MQNLAKTIATCEGYFFPLLLKSVEDEKKRKGKMHLDN